MKKITRIFGSLSGLNLQGDRLSGKGQDERIESRNGLHTLDHAQKIGFGSRSYRLVEIK